MSAALLPENTALAFLGETAWPPATLTTRQAEQLAATANACGRPNSDVLRRRLTVVRDQPIESWQIDFPNHFTPQEAALYEQPFAVLQQRAHSWLNPYTNPSLRRALARVSRFLAMPARADSPDWRWIEEDLLPDATLLVVARDDDFTHGVLQSSTFAFWWQHWRSMLSSDAIVSSFPFPWPPATPLSALTTAQEESRHAIARAARSGDNDLLNAAVLAAYGWPADSDDAALVEKLAELNRTRAG